MNNLHISLTEFRNESRVLKQTSSILKHRIAEKVYVAALHSDGLNLSDAYSEELHIHRFKLVSRVLPKLFFVQALKYFEFCIRIYLFFKSKKIGIVNVHSIALLPFGFFLKKAYKATLVYDTHELETETNSESGFRRKVSKLIERKLIHKADIVFVVSDSIADWYQSHYKMEKPVVVLNAPRNRTARKTNLIRQKLGIPETFRILLYQGGLSRARGIEYLIDAFKIRQTCDAVIVFMGAGEYANDIIDLARKNPKVFYLEPVPPEDVLDYTESADAGIHLIQNTCLNHYYCLPNKLFEYAMAGLPVIVSNMLEMKSLVEAYNMGVVVTENTPDPINEAIDRILTSDIEQMGQNAKKCAEDHSWEKQEAKMIRKYREVLTGTKDS